MNKVYILVCLFVAFSNAFAKSNDLSFEKQVKKWERKILAAEKSLALQQKNLQRNKYKNELREIRDEAAKEKFLSEEILKDKKELLLSLGDVPKEGEIEEDKKIKILRKKLEKDISIVDSRIKQSSLIESRAIKVLEEYNLKEIIVKKNQFFTKNENIYELFLNKEKILSDINSYNSSASKYLNLYSILTAFIILYFFYYLISHKIQEYITCKSNNKKTKISRTNISNYISLVSLGVLIDINIIDISEHLYLNNLVKMALSILIIIEVLKFINKGFITNIFSSSSVFKKSFYKSINFTISKIFSFFCFTIIIISLLGYSTLSFYISIGFSMSLFGIFSFVFLRDSIDVMGILIRNILFKDKNESLSPLYVILFEPVIAVFCTIMVLFFWGISILDIQDYLNEYKNGIILGNVNIKPIEFGIGIISFFTLLFITKFIQWFISDRVFPYAKIHSGLKSTTNTLVGYLGVLIAIVFSLKTIGLDLSSVAFIIGALSVGIGFGLHTVFSNFISGIILLFERPFNTGDWIRVGEQEGIVKKVRVRSTELETFSAASVIVPNTQLITETVVNWTLQNKIGRVEVSVGVSYDSNPEKIKSLLLNIVKNINSINKYPEPYVLFKDFGESSLDFEVRGYINNIEDKLYIASNIRYEIYKTFKENNIEIPFPQRDLHFKKYW